MLQQKLLMSNSSSLSDLGWQTFFQQQLMLDEWDEAIPARVFEQYKSEITAATESGVFNIHLLATMLEIVVGDWLLVDSQQHIMRLLDRKTCFSRKAAGSKVKKQLISSNIDTAFIVSSMNDDFNLNRIERFLSLVNKSGAEPVVLLSKSDQSKTPQNLVGQVQALDPFLMIEANNCLDAENEGVWFSILIEVGNDDLPMMDCGWYGTGNDLRRSIEKTTFPVVQQNLNRNSGIPKRKMQGCCNDIILSIAVKIKHRHLGHTTRRRERQRFDR